MNDYQYRKFGGRWYLVGEDCTDDMHVVQVTFGPGGISIPVGMKVTVTNQTMTLGQTNTITMSVNWIPLPKNWYF